MFKGWTIRRLIIVSFSIILALMVGMTTIAYMRLARIDKEARDVQMRTIPALYQSTLLQQAWSEDFLLTEEFVLQRDVTVRERRAEKILSNRALLDGLVSTYENGLATEGSRQAFDTFKSARTVYMRVQNSILDDVARAAELDQQAKVESALLPEFERGQTAMGIVVQLHKTESDQAVETITADVSTSMTSAILILGVALALAGICSVAVLRSITKPLATLNEIVELLCRGDFTRRVKLERNDELGALAEGFNRMTDELTMLVGQVKQSGLQVNTSVTEIAATAKEQQATASEIAATTTEISATSREISATSKELVKTMSDVSTVAEQSAALAGNGQIGLTHMEETMRQVMDAAGSVNAKLATLNEKAGDISQVVTTITKVADQTNLLSLNAAIEAEKAGEYGRGFAVVATEIRRLADQTAVATYDIDQMVKAIQSAVSAGVMSMDRFSEDVRRGMHAVQEVSGLLAQVIQQVQALAPRFEAVTEAMETQATGAEQITEALAQLSDAARQTVESLRQSNLAIDELNQVSVGLRNGVSRFTLQVA
jgi:methyl-accepting chemotaxis protein WspA